LVETDALRTGDTGAGEREDASAAENVATPNAGTGEYSTDVEQCGESDAHDSLEMAEAA
jgi:hypothetical protein